MDWKELERTIEDLARRIAPNAVTRHDHHIRGRSNVVRKLDVTISADFGLFSMLTVVECKHHKRRVRIGDVAKFASMLEDVGAHSGVMISSSGFTSGALNLAQISNIQLLNLRRAEAADQAVMIGEHTRFFMVVDELEVNETLIRTESKEGDPHRDVDQGLVDASGRPVGSVRDYRNSALSRIPRGIPVLGRLILSIVPDQVLYVVDGEQRVRITSIETHVVKHAKLYTAPVETSGRVLISPQDGEVRIREIEHTIDWRAVCDSQEGINLTLAEYLARGQTLNFITEIREADGVLSIRLTDRSPRT